MNAVARQAETVAASGKSKSCADVGQRSRHALHARTLQKGICLTSVSSDQLRSTSCMPSQVEQFRQSSCHCCSVLRGKVNRPENRNESRCSASSFFDALRAPRPGVGHSGTVVYSSFQIEAHITTVDLKSTNKTVITVQEKCRGSGGQRARTTAATEGTAVKEEGNEGGGKQRDGEAGGGEGGIVQTQTPGCRWSAYRLAGGVAGWWDDADGRSRAHGGCVGTGKSCCGKHTATAKKVHTKGSRVVILPVQNLILCLMNRICVTQRRRTAVPRARDLARPPPQTRPAAKYWLSRLQWQRRPYGVLKRRHDTACTGNWRVL